MSAMTEAFTPSDDFLGDDPYPSEAELDTIRNWPTEAGYGRLMAYVRERWRYADAGYWREPRRIRETPGGQFHSRYLISTAGWSGNEDMIGALDGNVMFRVLCSHSWRRGGHYEYRVPEFALSPIARKGG